VIDWYGQRVDGEEMERRSGNRTSRNAYRMKGVNRVHLPIPQLFRGYLDAKLTVSVRDFAGVFAWLRDCRYVRDQERYGRSDLWLHPEDFEKLREGDCEDHALWAWVQLVRQGTSARFTVGKWNGGHAWVTLFEEAGLRIFETTQKNPAYEPHPWDGHPEYIPTWSIDAEGEFFWHDPDPV